MDWLTFISNLVNAIISWPTALVVIVWMLKKPLADRIGEILTVKYKGLEIEFDKRMREVAIEAEKVLPPPSEPSLVEIKARDALAIALEERISNTSELLPPAKILQSWFLLENELRKLSERRGIERSGELPTADLAFALRATGVLDDQSYSIFKQLRNLRNQVVHVRPNAVTMSQALEYDSTVRRLVAKFSQL
jgi:hypothetical protein